MKIQRELPQFKNKRVLIAVTGERAGKLYLAENGSLKELQTIRTPIPHYSDNEGFFMTRSGRGATRSGAVREPIRDKIRAEFMKLFAEALHDNAERHQPETVYFCAPQQVARIMQKSFHTSDRKRITKTIFGNRTDRHPFELLKLLG
ncbi:MAG: hypothetical protein AAB407_02540 [Patescibacteria group bacterium]